jgi:hypothetical protein
MHYFKIMALIFLLALIGCGKPPFLNKVEKGFSEVSGGTPVSENQNNNFTYKWLVSPSLENISSMEISFSRPLDANLSMHAYLWMPEMGHGSSPIEVNKINSTDYILNEIAFIMPGIWVLHIEILENNRIIEQWQRTYTL